MVNDRRRLFEPIRYDDGSAQMRIYLDREETRRVGTDVETMARFLDTAVRALAEIRAGDWDTPSIEVVTGLEELPGAIQRQRQEETVFALEDLIPRLEAIRVTALRGYRAHGASHADLARVMGVKRSTAQSRWNALEATRHEWEEWARTGRDPRYPAPATGECDGVSVGVLIVDEQGRHLMFDRATPPVGCAPVAGHGDDHGSPEQTARDEVSEELGLTVSVLTQVTGGWRPNRCRRHVPEGQTPGHHWTIYRATVTGDLTPSERETRNARWLTTAELQDLTDRTAAYARGELTDAEFIARPGVEPVWAWWLNVLGIVGVDEADMARIEDLAERTPVTA
jgi:8-oxo-dGTP pyrophosphatase MutT (NUDIX family)